LDDLSWRRAFGLESEFEVVDDIVYDFMTFDKSNDFHFCAAVGTEEGIYFIDFADHFSPTPAGNKRGLFINDRRMSRAFTFLALLGAETKTAKKLTVVFEETLAAS
jgi:hypothetical protein